MSKVRAGAVEDKGLWHGMTGSTQELYSVVTPDPLLPGWSSVGQPQLHKTLLLLAWQWDGVPELSVRETHSMPAEERRIWMSPLW